MSRPATTFVGILPEIICVDVVLRVRRATLPRPFLRRYDPAGRQVYQSGDGPAQ